MGIFDQTARYALRAEPVGPITRILAESGLSVVCREFLDTRLADTR